MACMPKPKISAPVVNAECVKCKKIITKLSDCVRITYPPTKHEEVHCVACYFKSPIK